MGLFKGKKDDEDGNRSALFGSRSKNNKSPNPATQNPYANVPTPADAYNAAKAKAGVPGYAQHGPPGGPAGGDRYGGGAAPPGRGGYGGPPPGQNRYGGPPPAEKERYGASPAPQGRSGYPDDKKGGSGGYGADKYGAQGGYGADRYGPSGRVGGAEGPNPPAKHGAGGYGGLGGAPAPAGDADDGRAALFGGARDRVQRRTDQQMGYGGGPPPAYEEGGNDEFNTGRDPNEPQYEAYGDRQLTAEEEEEEDVTATKQQIRFIKQEDVSSTRNALRIAAQAEETGMNTLARIGAQGERIHNTEKNLDLTSNHNRMAEDKARELKTLNRSMFAVHVSNPFTAGSRAEKRDNDVLDRHHLEREQREATRYDFTFFPPSLPPSLSSSFFSLLSLPITTPHSQ